MSSSSPSLPSLNIGMVCFPTYGGSGVIATELGKALAEKGHKIHFITYAPPMRLDHFDKNIYYHEVSAYAYPLFEHSPYALALASKIVDITKTHQLHALHVHYAIPHAAAAYLARSILQSENIALPLITTLHGTDITLTGKDASYEPVVRFCIEESDRVTTVSEALRKETYKHFSIKKEIEVIPNFVNLRRFAPSQQNMSKLQCQVTGKLVVHVSNMRHVKRVNDVIHVFARLQEHLPATLFIIGDGPSRSEAEARCRAYGIEKKVQFFGKTGAIEEILRLADVFLMPSETESFGLAALEAMAARVPVVATQVGGLPELLQHEAGFVCPLGDIEAMVDKCLHILHPDRLEYFKEKAFQRAQDFDIHKILPRYEALYFKVIGKNSTFFPAELAS